jgi:hypothetical protein
MASSSTSLPPPVGGLNARDSLADMPPNDAIILDNIVPSTDDCYIRGGNSEHATGMSGPTETLIEYVPTTGAGQLYAANNGSIFDVSSSGSVGSAVSTGHSNDRWQQVQIGTAAGQFVRLFNGSDTPLVYDGSTWGTTPAITGPTVTSLIWANVHQKRMWMGEKESLDAYYLPVNSVGGAATKFTLAGIARLGGFIMGMGTWTRDAGDGMDDVAVFLTSEGEAIVYSGTDPSSAATWGLIGVFRIGKPIGRRCILRAGSDLILITQDGFLPLSAILSMDRSQSRLVSLSDKISKLVNDAVRSKKDLFGWQPILYPKSTMMIFNIPQTSTTSQQFVFNTITGSPCRFTGINAVCFGMLNDNIYWGGADGNVNKFDDGNTDLGSNIEVDALQAFNYFKSPSRNKVFKMVEPIFTGAANPNAAVEVNVDFQLKAPTSNPQPSATGAALWGIAKWGIGKWGSHNQTWRGWRGVRGLGRSGAVRIRMSSNSGKTRWIATNITYVNGGQL